MPKPFTPPIARPSRRSQFNFKMSPRELELFDRLCRTRTPPGVPRRTRTDLLREVLYTQFDQHFPGWRNGAEKQEDGA